MKYNPFNNDQGRIQPPPDLQHERLDAPDDLPELRSESIVNYAWIAALVIGVVLAIVLVVGSSAIVRSLKAYYAKEAYAEKLCTEKYGLFGQWRYDGKILECSSAVTGMVTRISL